MVRIQEQEEEDDTRTRPQRRTSSSNDSTTMNIYSSPFPSPSPSPPTAPQPSSPPPDSPDTASSISSDHTFHGFSPSNSHLPSPSPSPPVHPASTPPALLPAPVPVPAPVVANRFVRDHPEAVTKTESDAETGFAGESGVARRKVGRPVSALRNARSEKLVKWAGLVLRFCEFVVCLVSFSVMAADKRRGWALDSFDRYIEFRYSMSVNIVGFAYSGLQGLGLLCRLTTGKDVVRSQLRHYFDFTMDQILAYLLLSSSSSAFTRVDDWISNWGKDKFPAMASASAGVSFVAFVAFALSSLISGYVLCTDRFT